MKKTLLVTGFIALFLVVAGLLPPQKAVAGERAVCVVYLNDGGLTAQSTGDVIAVSTLDGTACPSERLQPDGGYLAWDGGYNLTLANGQPADGGLAGCNQCDFKGATSISMQCSDPVYYSEKWDGGVNNRRQHTERGVVPATTLDTLVDFDINPDPYRIDFRGTNTYGANQHVSVKPVSASSSNRCVFSTIKRAVP